MSAGEALGKSVRDIQERLREHERLRLFAKKYHPRKEHRHVQ